jgi:hypothetical protein
MKANIGLICKNYQFVVFSANYISLKQVMFEIVYGQLEVGKVVLAEK